MREPFHTSQELRYRGRAAWIDIPTIDDGNGPYWRKALARKENLGEVIQEKINEEGSNAKVELFDLGSKAGVLLPSNEVRVFDADSGTIESLLSDILGWVENHSRVM